MPEPDYEYYGMMATTWDLFRGDTSSWEDRSFYLSLIHESGQPVLDVGCGTGRLLLDYLALGVDIDGVDISPEMLQLCREKAMNSGMKASLFTGDMETMRLPRQYRTILVPSSSFQLLVEPEHADKAIMNLYHHLLPAGRLVMPFMRLRKKGDPLEHDWHLTGEASRPEDGSIVRRWSNDRFDPMTQLEHNEDRYEVIRDDEVIYTEYHQRSPATREYSQRQALGLYIKAGFVDLQVYDGFTHQPAIETSEIFTVSGERP
jgi:SAM-dependent methyltransferase